MKKKYSGPKIGIKHVFNLTDVLLDSIGYDEETGDYIGNWSWGD